MTAVTTALIVTHDPSPLAASDRLFEGLAFRFFSPSRPISDRIIIIGITEDTLATLPYRSPIDRKFLADLLMTLLERGVQAIGLDIVFDRETEIEKDAMLRMVIAGANHPIVMVSVSADSSLSDRQRNYLDSFLAGQRQGQANLLRESFDNVVRDYPARLSGKPSFAVAVAGAVGVRNEPNQDTFPIMWRRTMSRPFATYPAQNIDLLPPQWLEGKIALIGTMIPGQDEHRTPFSIFSRPLHGVEIHAHALSQILENQFAKPSFDLWIIGGTALIGLLLAIFASGVVLITSMVGFIGLLWAGSLLIFANDGPLILPLAPSLSFAIANGGIRFWTARTERRDRQILNQLFSRFVSKPVASEVWKERDMFLAGGRPRPHALTATVLFSDIAGFTPLTEKMPAEPLFAWLDHYIDTMVSIIEAHDGVVLRFIGDGILAVFGAPIAHHEQQDIDADAANAVTSALAMGDAVARLNMEWQKVGLPCAVIRVGIYTGPLLAGSLGSGSHMEYCLQGDTVNTAARLEALGKNYLSEEDEYIIIIGETTFERVKSGFVIKNLGAMRLKGKEQITTIYRVVRYG